MDSSFRKRVSVKTLVLEDYIITVPFLTDFKGGSVVKNLPANQETEEMWVLSQGREDPLE